MEMQQYIDATESARKAFYEHPIEGSLVMLNLLKFKDKADYTGFETLASQKEVSGKAAYKAYMAHTAPFLHKAGGEVVFWGNCGPFLIGPDAEYWDMAMLVRHASKSAFLSFAKDPAYLKGIGHRVAALDDSRLLPITAMPLPS